MLSMSDIQQTSALRLLSSPPTLPDRPSHDSVAIMGDAVLPRSPAGGAGA